MTQHSCTVNDPAQGHRLQHRPFAELARRSDTLAGSRRVHAVGVSCLQRMLTTTTLESALHAQQHHVLL
jgi:hypothetical protein